MSQFPNCSGNTVTAFTQAVLFHFQLRIIKNNFTSSPTRKIVTLPTNFILNLFPTRLNEILWILRSMSASEQLIQMNLFASLLEVSEFALAYRLSLKFMNIYGKTVDLKSLMHTRSTYARTTDQVCRLREKFQIKLWKQEAGNIFITFQGEN